MRKAFVLVALVACGDVAHHDLPDASSAPPTKDAPGPDAPTQPGLGAFSAPVPIAELDTVSSERGPSLTSDLLEIYFVSDRAGGLGGADVYTSKRPNVATAWAPPTLVMAVSSADAEAHTYVTPDGLQLYVAVTRAVTTTGTDLYVAVRANRQAVWSAPTLATDLDSAADDTAIGMSADGLQLVLDSTRAGGLSGRDLYLAKRADTSSAWGIPEGIAELNDANTQKTPQLADGGRALWFVQTEPGTADDFYVARRADTNSPFGAAVAVPELDSALTDVDPWISDDQRTIVFASTRSGNFDLFVATR
jgi:hypothetical protein